MGELIHLHPVSVARTIAGVLEDLLHSPSRTEASHPPDAFGWEVMTTVDARAVRWYHAKYDAVLQELPGTPTWVHLSYQSHDHYWHDRSVADVVVGLETGMIAPPEICAPSTRTDGPEKP